MKTKVVCHLNCFYCNTSNVAQMG